MPHLGLVLLLEPLHGVTYACAKTASIEFVARVAEVGFEASAQGVMSSLSGGLAPAVSLPLAGLVTDKLGANVLYRGAAGLVMTALAGQRLVPLVFAGRRGATAGTIELATARADVGDEEPAERHDRGGVLQAIAAMWQAIAPTKSQRSALRARSPYSSSYSRVPRSGEGDEF